ncbi:DNA-binding transcriptional MerR regulator [Allocatelliglobosispora scoriae]|uniref:DNA-binding transcriptional MerR regulator n=1 Tax=Allocatelliglobosispora scoriae TaxID=643052 RepID=A0A841BIK8_9ACTN|nr:MerR family transcriptional regulator [Allocatelliglobosispora scoriae]MBB5866650.1 DNA-binding transcriptional MerR regulator [Allocatelliglobosispora scoriae]
MASIFDDANYPAYTMSTAAGLLGVQPGFLRSLGDGGLLHPARSDGGHRRYSRHDLAMAERARQVVDTGMNLAAACRIVQLEYEVARLELELAQARAQIAELTA